MTLKSQFCRKNIILFCHYVRSVVYGRHNISQKSVPENIHSQTHRHVININIMPDMVKILYCVVIQFFNILGKSIPKYCTDVSGF